ncbi:helix-turn-helix domain-containing protein [Streptomyces sp. PR69]|uniref:helix-turn-helix domain-containing protein n=1 Tax=Streptomyces sp. PR69 TaxID=2984950 RepID=UPI0022641636|nr:helix-turn-helix transcriptional regulator [Streptomyces sp. PR69]
MDRSEKVPEKTPEKTSEEIAAFAERLRELKERSGRSYGALAAQLHISTSTLHRYCHGRAVPSGYAPVERLARLCGASAAERMELHQRWVLASAVRDRAESGGRPQGEATAPDADPGTDAGRGAAPDTVPQTGTRTSLPPDTPAASGARRRLRPRTRILAAALATVAVVVGGVVAVELAESDAETGAERDAGEGRTPAAEAAPAPERPPLSWSADSHVWASGCGHTYLVDRAPADVPPPPVAQDARKWAADLGAVHGGDAITRVTVRPAKDAGPVVVQELHIRVTERREPLPWTAYAMDQGCGGALTPAVYKVDLDADRPVARPVDGVEVSGATGEVKELPAPRLPYQVRADDPLVLRVEAQTARCDCDWYLELTWTSGERKGVLRVDDGGRPFRTSAVSPGGGYWYAGEQGWTRS